MPKEPWTKKRILKIVSLVILVGGIIVLKLLFSVSSTIDSGAIDKNNNALDAFNTGNNDQAISQFQQASNDAVTTKTRIASLKNLAYVYSTENKNSDAKSAFSQALSLTEKDSFDYYLVSGELALLNDDAETAYTDYLKAYNLNPDDFQINNSLNLFYLDTDSKHPEYQNYSYALLYAKKAYSAGQSAVAEQNLGIAYYFNGDYADAINIFKNTSLDKDTYVAYFLGLSYAHIDDSFDAKLYLQKAIDNGVSVPQSVLDYLKTN